MDTVLRQPRRTEDNSPSNNGELIKRGRVVVKEIGPQTKKGKYHVTLVRYKQFELTEVHSNN